MSVDPSLSPLEGDNRAQEGWSSFLHPSTASASTVSPNGGSDASPARLSTPSSSSPSSSAHGGSSVVKKARNTERSSPSSRVANLLTLTELRKAAWARIYSSGIHTGNATISTTSVPTWKQFDSLMIKRHRYIAVDPRDNRTLGWIACFHPYPHLSPFYDDVLPEPNTSGDGRTGRIAELQIMVAEAERGRGVGTFLVQALLASLIDHAGYSSVQASFFPENEPCQKLLERCGFQTVSMRKNALKMLDGPRKAEWRDLVTVEVKLPPLPRATPPLPGQPQQHEPSPSAPAVIDMTVDPNALFKRPRLD